MIADPIADVLVRVDAGELGDPLPVLAYLAGQAVRLDDAELYGAGRRALQAVAADLHTQERRDQLARSIDDLVLRVRDLPVAREAALFLAGDVDLAWRLFALALLAEELAE